jgi:2-phosphoglycerate kinase
MGGTGVGTSSIAMQVAAHPAVEVRSVIGSDALREVVRQFVPPDVAPELVYSSYDGYLAYQDSAMLIPAYRKQAQLIGLGIAAIIRRAVHENIRLIIEGVHVLPEQIYAHIGRDEKKQIAAVLIDIESAGIHRNRIAERSAFAPDRDTSRQLANFDRIRQVRSYLREMAAMNHIPVVFNDSPDMKAAIDACVAQLLDTA